MKYLVDEQIQMYLLLSLYWDISFPFSKVTSYIYKQKAEVSVFLSVYINTYCPQTQIQAYPLENIFSKVFLFPFIAVRVKAKVFKYPFFIFLHYCFTNC